MPDIGPPSSSTETSALRTFRANRAELSDTLKRLSTGERINRGADDPAGLITSENLRGVLAALDAESQQLQRTDTVVTTADAALGEVSDLLVEAEALAVANAGDGLSSEERAANQAQIDSIVQSVNRIASTTSFNGTPLLDGSATVEAGEAAVAIESVSVEPVGEGAEAQEAIAAARESVASLRGRLGAFSRYTIGSRLEALSVATENIAAAESQVRDTDYARETGILARNELLDATSLAALDVSNVMRGNVIDLLG
jgi:flagellin